MEVYLIHIAGHIIVSKMSKLKRIHRFPHKHTHTHTLSHTHTHTHTNTHTPYVDINTAVHIVSPLATSVLVTCTESGTEVPVK